MKKLLFLFVITLSMSMSAQVFVGKFNSSHTVSADKVKSEVCPTDANVVLYEKNILMSVNDVVTEFNVVSQVTYACSLDGFDCRFVTVQGAPKIPWELETFLVQIFDDPKLGIRIYSGNAYKQYSLN